MTYEEMLSAALADRDKEIDRLRTDLHELRLVRAWQAETIESLQRGMHPADLVNEISIELYNRLQSKQAVIARVRELCETEISDARASAEWGYVKPEDVLRALDGDPNG